MSLPSKLRSPAKDAFGSLDAENGTGTGTGTFTPTCNTHFMSEIDIQFALRRGMHIRTLQLTVTSPLNQCGLHT